MRGQFADTAQISPDGKQVLVTGPVTEWEDDEFGAVIVARIGQPGANGSGATIFIQKGAAMWEATISIHGNKVFRPGVATAKANATVSLSDGGVEPYNWPDVVELLA